MATVRIAVVGSGIAGLTCAHVLGPRHDVDLYEAADRLGGHANTVDVDDPDVGPLRVDTGFIVHNDRNYPNLVRLFDQLGVTTRDSEMSFAVTDRQAGISYRATSPNTLFADRRNLLRRDMWRMVADIVRFWRDARRFLDQLDPDPEVTIGQFLADGRYSPAFVDLHFVPMGAAVWSADPRTFDAYPALSLLRFLANHGLLGVGDRPRWKTVEGGSRSYVDAIAARFPGRIHLGCPVRSVRRDADGVAVGSARGLERYDRVILACHSDQNLGVLDDATPDEKDLLGSIRYTPNLAVLHTDASVLSPTRRAWAAWNYERLEAATASTVTYDLTTLQRLPGPTRYLVSLNLEDRIDAERVLGRFSYAHPVFDRAAIAAQARLGDVDGAGGVHFCGAWAGNGFHEDGMASALDVCRRLGVDW